MTAAPRTPYALLLALLAALTLTACIEDDPIDIEEPPVPAATELRKDGDNFTAPRLPAGVHRFAVRFSESELRAFEGRELTGVSLFVAPGATPEYLDIRVYRGGDVVPGTEVAFAGEDQPRDFGEFIAYAFEEPVVIDAEAPLWIEAEVEIATAQQTIGCDAPGSGVQGGDWLWSEDRWLPFSERTPERINWNLRGLLR